MQAKARILLVEDDPHIGKLVSRLLAAQGYEVRLATRREEAGRALAEAPFDLMLLDINLPDGNGLDLCRDIRSREPDVPVLFLTARQEEEHAVRAFTLGADDYIRKPFGREELVARVARYLRSRQGDLAFGPLVLKENGRELRANGASIPLTPTEHAVLRALLRKPGEVVSRETLFGALRGGADANEGALESHLSHLRSKLRKAGVEDVKIVSVYGSGYRIQKA